MRALMETPKALLSMRTSANALVAVTTPKAMVEPVTLGVSPR